MTLRKEFLYFSFLEKICQKKKINTPTKYLIVLAIARISGRDYKQYFFIRNKSKIQR